MIYADTSFLFSVYGNDVHSSRAVGWLKSQRSALTLTSLSEFELGNVLRFAEFRKVMAPGDAGLFWAQFEADCLSGRVKVQVCNLARFVDEAKRLSATHTVSGGHRGFNILHVSTALVIHARQFLTFDANQKRLAEAEGLVVPF